VEGLRRHEKTGGPRHSAAESAGTANRRRRGAIRTVTRPQTQSPIAAVTTATNSVTRRCAASPGLGDGRRASGTQSLLVAGAAWRGFRRNVSPGSTRGATLSPTSTPPSPTARARASARADNRCRMLRCCHYQSTAASPHTQKRAAGRGQPHVPLWTSCYGLVQVAPDGNAVLPLGRLAWKPQLVLAPAPRVAFCPEMPRAVTV